MFKRSIGLGFVGTLIGGVAALLLATPAANAGSGADLTIHNETKSDMEVWIFEDTALHPKRTGGVHAGDIKVHGKGTAHVKDCKFSVYLFKPGSDEYHHKTFTDCKITDITIVDADH